MIRRNVQDVDNRDLEQMYDYLEARVEAMKRRIAELEAENARLSTELFTVWDDCEHRFAATA